MPRLSMPASANTAGFTLTPDTLRYMGKVVAQLNDRIHDLQSAIQTIESRSTMPVAELQRMCAKCGELLNTIDSLKGARRVATETRFKALIENQVQLFVRTDRVLQAMVNQASPELSDNEKKWFEELKRLKGEINGSGQFDENSLISRTRLVTVSSQQTFTVLAHGAL